MTQIPNFNGILFTIVLTLALYSSAHADDMAERYAPAKVVYDFTSGRPTELENILDRASMLQNIYHSHPFDASILIVVHDSAIPLFTKKQQNTHLKTHISNLMQRSRSLSVGDIVQFRVCEASARQQGFDANELQDFVVMVPMADAELVMLQQSGYAYLR